MVCNGIENIFVLSASNIHHACQSGVQNHVVNRAKQRTAILALRFYMEQVESNKHRMEPTT